MNQQNRNYKRFDSNVDNKVIKTPLSPLSMSSDALDTAPSVLHKD